MSSSNMVFMSACVESLMFSVETETHLHTMNQNFGKLCELSQLSLYSVYYALTVQLLKIKTKPV